MATASLAQGKVGLRRALLTLAVAGFALGVAVVLVLATSDHAELRGWEATVAVLIGWGFIGAGLYAWWRRPANNFGPLMTATGFLFFVSELGASDQALVYTLATLGGNLFLAVVIHMLLAMPSGRLRTRGERCSSWRPTFLRRRYRASTSCSPTRRTSAAPAARRARC